MHNNYLQSNSFNVGGIHRAILIDVNDELRAYIPGIHNYRDDFYLEGSLYNINEEVVLNEFKTFPKVQWNVPNEEAKQHEKPFHPCWVTFENNDIQRPIIMGWCGDGIMYSAGSSGSNYNISENNTDGEYKSGYVSGSGSELIVPDEYGTIETYEKEIRDVNDSIMHGWAESAESGPIRKNAIHTGRMTNGNIFGLKNCAIIDNRLMIATKKNIGGDFPINMGDYLDVYFLDGTIWNCIVMDAKGADAANPWGHNNGKSVVEIIYWDYKTNSGNQYKKIKKIVKVGSYK